ncbi:hypothetical protein DSCA_01720 [Desulfosarcina alkanivorans]|uniref:PNPLA domain-containing protein n=1 Tax=Desulfosarcina alkanivorans TaxID=571177 RepID=A0A5K7YA24_9BACT|nr:hypothetical protein [Desulfosarcina alkanivorans]BBO66242.1 hypothetical protein DSCA_01720 [Desulfosarcina alkanivorans]
MRASGERLVFLAGRRALESIRSQGLSPDHVKVVAGAAGGPKWLILGHLDRVLFGIWFRERREPLHLLGSSIGSWRFAADSCADPVAAIDRMEAAYIHQAYDKQPAPREISEKSRAIIAQTLGSEGPVDVLDHPVSRSVRRRHHRQTAACLPSSFCGSVLENGYPLVIPIPVPVRAGA